MYLHMKAISQNSVKVTHVEGMQKMGNASSKLYVPRSNKHLKRSQREWAECLGVLNFPSRKRIASSGVIWKMVWYIHNPPNDGPGTFEMDDQLLLERNNL